MSALDKFLRLAGTTMAGDDDSENDPGAIVQALDSVLDSAADAARDADVSTWPPEARQMYALVNAADAIVDDLLEAMGVEDPDEGGEPATASDVAMTGLHSVEAIRLAGQPPWLKNKGDNSGDGGDKPAAADKKHGFKPDPENRQVCAVCGKGPKADQHMNADGEPIMDAKGGKEMKASGTRALDKIVALAGSSDDSKKPYGDVKYADPGYQDDNKKRYPIDTADHVRAAWSYINQGDNTKAYSSDQVAQIKGRIKAAASRLGVEISEG